MELAKSNCVRTDLGPIRYAHNFRGLSVAAFKRKITKVLTVAILCTL